MTLKRAFRLVIRRAVCDKTYVDVLQIKKRKVQCNRVPSIQADCILIIVEIIVPFMSAFPAATVCSVILFVHNLIISVSFLKKIK
jgi:hypothetical protein